MRCAICEDCGSRDATQTQGTTHDEVVPPVFRAGGHGFQDQRRYEPEADEIRRYLMSGAEALKAENIIKLFEALKDRKAISDEIANVERKLKEK